MEKAIEIKRRAQRCIQNGDLDGALKEYEKLVTAEDSDPYNYVLLADLLFKRGEGTTAVQRYLSAMDAYQKAGLFKNAIAVAKKMLRLALSPTIVLERLAVLHALDGLATEAVLYYTQFAEHLVREDKLEEAVVALRKAFDACGDEVKTLERLAEVHTLAGNKPEAARTLAEAALHHRRLGAHEAADACAAKAEKLHRGATVEVEHRLGEGATPSANGEAPPSSPGFTQAYGHVALDAKSESEAGPAPLPISMPGPSARTESQPAPPPAPVARLPIEEPPRFVPPSEPVEQERTLDRGATGTTSIPSGLRFESPADADRPADLEQVMAIPQAPTPQARPSMGDIERLLSAAQERFRAGDRDGAAGKLVEAAQAYESVERLDNAASIYRSLCRSPQSSPVTMKLWLENCERRSDRREAAEVACELGDRALQDGDPGAARDWFERACAYDQANVVAQRRLARLSEMSGGVATAVAETAVVPTIEPEVEAEPTPSPVIEEAPESRPPMLHPQPEATIPEPEPAPVAVAPPASAPVVAAPAAPAAPQSPSTFVEAPTGADPTFDAEGGRIEYSVGRGEAVTFDLGSLLSEFQRGIEAQLSGDTQSHYDLGVAYREMGLLDQAVEAFRFASGDPTLAHRCCEMIGRCMLDQGRFEDAAQEFAAALEAPGLEGISTVNLRYQLGLALEAAGQPTQALVEFERVFTADPSYPDVALKLRVLRKTLESA